MMNYSEAVRKSLTPMELLHQMNCQALTELSRPLTELEVDALTKNFTPMQLMKGIKEVYFSLL